MEWQELEQEVSDEFEELSTSPEFDFNQLPSTRPSTHVIRNYQPPPPRPIECRGCHESLPAKRKLRYFHDNACRRRWLALRRER